MELEKQSVTQYLEQVSSDLPAPGGGSASALCGAQGAGLVAMVAKLSLKKKKLEPYYAFLEEIARKADSLAEKLERQISLDAEAYDGLARAFRMPKETVEEKALRGQAIDEATAYAARVPLDTMELAYAGLCCAKELAEHFNTNCASDLGCAVYGLQAGLQGAWMNVRINIGGLKDREIAKELQSAGEKLAAASEGVTADLLPEISEQL